MTTAKESLNKQLQQLVSKKLSRKYEELHPTAENILDKTMHVIVNHERNMLSMRKIASLAGIKLASLQRYFKTFEGLITALIEREMRLVMQNWMDFSKTPEGELGDKDLLKELRHILPSAARVKSDRMRMYLHLWAYATHNKIAGSALKELYHYATLRFAYLVANLNPKLTKEQCLNRAIVLLSATEGNLVLKHCKVVDKKNIDEVHRELETMVLSFVKMTP